VRDTKCDLQSSGGMSSNWDDGELWDGNLMCVLGMEVGGVGNAVLVVMGEQKGVVKYDDLL